MNQRKIRSIQSRLARLARNNCANYEGGKCLIMPGGQCVLEIETDRLPANVCPYFMKFVLPADSKLMDEYLEYFPRGYPLKRDQPSLKPCVRCGDLFEKRGNRAKYCAHCKKVVKRAQTVRSNRNKVENRRVRSIYISTFLGAKNE